MKKKYLTGMLLILFMMIIFVTSVDTIYAGYGKKNYKHGNFTYRRYGTENNYILLYDYTGNKKKLTIPVNFNGYRVIEAAMFGNVRELHIPKKVFRVSISSSKKLKKISVEEGHGRYIAKDNLLLNSGKSKFFDREEGTVLVEVPGGRKNIKIPEYVQEIFTYAFMSSNAVTVTLSPNVSILHHGAFTRSEKLKNVYFNTGLKEIADNAFSECKSLEKAELPEGLKVLGTGAFFHCINLKNVTIPSTLRVIEYGLFEDCSSLESITIPDNIRKIRTKAFSGCENLKSIYIYNPKCKIERVKRWTVEHLDGEETIPKTTTIYGYRNSTAHKYAKKHGNRFIELKKE